MEYPHKKISINEIHWIPTPVIRNDEEITGEDLHPQHFLANMTNVENLQDSLRFNVESHLGNDNVLYTYTVFLDKQKLVGEYFRLSDNHDNNYKSRVSFEIFNNLNEEFYLMIWNEFNGRSETDSSHREEGENGFTIWEGDWICFFKVKRVSNVP